MAKVITVSRTFPAHHTKAGQETNFVQKIWKSLNIGLPVSVDADILEGEVHKLMSRDWEPKHHTIRAGKRWKTGDKASLRIWSGRPYHSKQITIAPDVEVKVFDFEVRAWEFYIDGKFIYENRVTVWHHNIEELAKNDGLTHGDLYSWFKLPANFSGQIICWNPEITY